MTFQITNQITIDAAAKSLGRSVDTLRNWDRNGILVAKRLPNGHRYYEQEQLNEMLGKLNGITQQAAAKQLGVSAHTLRRWEREQRTDRPRSRYAIGATRYYSQFDLDRYLSQQERGSDHATTTI